MSQKLKVGLLLAVVTVLLLGSAAAEYSLWTECRSTNSFWYCVRVLGK